LQPLLQGDRRCETTGDASAFVLPTLSEAKFDNPLKVTGLQPSINDQVLACARYFAEASSGLLTVLTDDRVLAIKASVCDLSAESLTSFVGNMAMLQCEAINQQPDLFTTDPIDGLEVESFDQRSCGLEVESFDQTSCAVALPPGLCEACTGGVNIADLVPKLDNVEDSAGSSTAEGEGGTEESTGSECPSPRSDVMHDTHMHVWQEKRRSDADFIVLRGLPFTATEAQVLEFVKKSGVRSKDLLSSECVSLLANAEGRPSGFAEIRLSKSAKFADVYRRLHMKYLGDRYIEALPPKSGNKSRSNRRWRRKFGKW